MSLLVKGGITRLSELEIDADKDWQSRGISNIKELAPAMAKGDLIARGDSVLIRLHPGSLGYVLTSAGPLHIPSWQPAGGELKYYYPVPIELGHAVAILGVDRIINRSAPVGTDHKQTYEDAPADNIRRLTPAVALADTEDIVAVDESHNENAPVATECAIEYGVGGAVLDDGGVQTDYTAEINSPTANDVKLLPDAPLEVDDAFYVGLAQPWDQLWLNIGVPGGGNWSLTEEYWNGVTWSALTILKDNASQFMAGGRNQVRWTRPGDWALTSIQGMSLYWMRFRVANVITYTTQPLGTQGWCEVLL